MQENVETWALAVEFSAVLYDEEVDLMGILQAQNEQLAEKRKVAKGLRGDGKLSMVKSLKKKYNLNMVGLLETKREEISVFDVARIWGSSSIGWEYVESVGAIGGLLLIWDDIMFQRTNCYKGERWLCVEGVLTKNNFQCAYCLVYETHGREEKKVVWEELSYIAGLCQVPFCFLGDLNDILQVDDRKGLTSLSASAEEFKGWVHDIQLLDLPLTDRKFTWFRGRSCSWIDRVLVNIEWVEKYPDIRLRGGPRGLSDHYPLILEESQLKALTVPLRQWHNDHFRGMENRIMKFEEEIHRLDNQVSDGIYDGTTEARRKALVSFCEKWYIRKEIH
ncbi:uncharacterized protein LOC107461112 [Arachis duranensis]|uniref:Uncharacterized protein LOC107461112 n=1 Tax=Arachis duranensis TaxID=130453 RepID=A0A6P4BTV9_ARADU|nr:uncharacterized protein LOC107461112 [Arachis duranensis]